MVVRSHARLTHRSVRILDIKGRRRHGRSHIVPLLEQAEYALASMRGEKLVDFLFTSSDGTEAVTYDIFRAALARVVADMAVAGELEGPAFTPGGIRRTVETRLAALGYSEEVRGHVQSHGLSGVQKRHYNKYEYDSEKRAAIKALYTLVTGADSVIVWLRQRPAK